MIESQERHIILFDGACNFCHDSVLFVIKHDPKQKFCFASVQSDVGQEIITYFDVPQVGEETFLLVKNNNCYFKTNASLEIAKDLDGLWPIFSWLKIIPRPLRDSCYNVFARNRYRLFGKKDKCVVPTKDTADRFLE